MTKEIEIDPQSVEQVHDLRDQLDAIHKCLEDLKKGLLPWGPEPWPVPKAPEHGAPGGGFGGEHDRPDGVMPPPEPLTPVSLFGDTVLKPLVRSPVDLQVSQRLPISFQLTEDYGAFGATIRSPYVGSTVTLTINTGPTGGMVNAGLIGAGGGGLTITGTTDAAGIVTFPVLGLRRGPATMVASALGETATVTFNVM